jgi:hypothetical protein
MKMFSIYKEIRKLGAVFAEYPTEPGRQFIEAYRENGELFLWVGRLHLIASSAKRITRKGFNTAAAALGFLWFEGLSLTSLIPSVPKASAAALVALAAVQTAAVEAVSDESLADTTLPVEESALWLSSPASDFPVAFVPEETASLSTSR